MTASNLVRFALRSLAGAAAAASGLSEADRFRLVLLLRRWLASARSVGPS